MAALPRPSTRVLGRRVKSLLVAILCAMAMYGLIARSPSDGGRRLQLHIAQEAKAANFDRIATSKNVLSRPLPFSRIKRGHNIQASLGKKKRFFKESTENRTFYHISELDRAQKSRLNQLNNECRKNKYNHLGMFTTQQVYDRIEVSERYNYLYCPLLKVGSTFFRRLFHVMRLGLQVNSPYDIDIMRALRAKRSHLGKMKPEVSKIFLKKATSVMFVREPFSRLLSGYTDKLFAPNPWFWRTIGERIIKEFRNVSKGFKRPEYNCAYDVSFAEFIRYVIKSEQTKSKWRDIHFAPISDQCKPCELNYTVLGKMESFLPDLAYTMKMLGNPVSKEKLHIWAKEASHDAIKDSIYSPFGWKKNIKKCMSWEEALKRIWRKLQIRGIILLEDKFPFTVNNSRGEPSRNKFFQTVTRLHKNADKEKLKTQKTKVLVESYSEIIKKDIAAITDLFIPDFRLFQYNEKPSFIYDRALIKEFTNKHDLFSLDSI